MRGTGWAAAAAAGAVAFVLGTAALPVAAHETKAAGAVRLTIGWADEPALSATKNAVEVVVADANGAPLANVPASLRVEVSLGKELVVLALQPDGRPGAFSAPIVPTRPGTYTFHLTGTVGNEAVDVTSTCSDATFDCVTDVAAAQFPAQEPIGGVTERIERESRRVREAQRAASDARRLSIGASALAAAAVATAVFVGRRRRSGGD